MKWDWIALNVSNISGVDTPTYSKPNLANQFVYYYNMIHRIPREEKEDRITKEIITKKYLNRILTIIIMKQVNPIEMLPHQGLTSSVKITLAI